MCLTGPGQIEVLWELGTHAGNFVLRQRHRRQRTRVARHLRRRQQHAPLAGQFLETRRQQQRRLGRHTPEQFTTAQTERSQRPAGTADEDKFVGTDAPERDAAFNATFDDIGPEAGAGCTGHGVHRAFAAGNDRIRNAVAVDVAQNNRAENRAGSFKWFAPKFVAVVAGQTKEIAGGCGDKHVRAGHSNWRLNGITDLMHPFHHAAARGDAINVAGVVAGNGDWQTAVVNIGHDRHGLNTRASRRGPDTDRRQGHATGIGGARFDDHIDVMGEIIVPVNEHGVLAGRQFLFDARATQRQPVAFRAQNCDASVGRVGGDDEPA